MSITQAEGGSGTKQLQHKHGTTEYFHITSSLGFVRFANHVQLCMFFIKN